MTIFKIIFFSTLNWIWKKFNYFSFLKVEKDIIKKAKILTINYSHNSEELIQMAEDRIKPIREKIGNSYGYAEINKNKESFIIFRGVFYDLSLFIYNRKKHLSNLENVAKVSAYKAALIITLEETINEYTKKGTIDIGEQLKVFSMFYREIMKKENQVLSNHLYNNTYPSWWDI